MSDTVKIKYEVHADDWHSRGEVELPSWCAGSPREAVSLYLFGSVLGNVQGVTRAWVVAEPIVAPYDEAPDSSDEPVDGIDPRVGVVDD